MINLRLSLSLSLSVSLCMYNAYTTTLCLSVLYCVLFWKQRESLLPQQLLMKVVVTAITRLLAGTAKKDDDDDDRPTLAHLRFGGSFFARFFLGPFSLFSLFFSFEKRKTVFQSSDKTTLFFFNSNKKEAFYFFGHFTVPFFFLLHFFSRKASIFLKLFCWLFLFFCLISSTRLTCYIYQPHFLKLCVYQILFTYCTTHFNYFDF